MLIHFELPLVLLNPGTYYLQILELQIFFYDLITPKRPLTHLINMDRILLQKCKTMVQQDSTRLNEYTHILFAIFGPVYYFLRILQVLPKICQINLFRDIPSQTLTLTGLTWRLTGRLTGQRPS